MSAPAMPTGGLTQSAFGRGRARRGAIGGPTRLGLVAAAATLLATAPLSAIFAGWTWLFQCTVAVGAVVAAATAARALRAPLWVQPLAMLGALLLALTWLFPSGEELLGILPSPATLAHFGVVLDGLSADVRGNAIPVPDAASILLVTTLGVGLVAIVIDLFAVGLRRPALAGLPMLAIYSVPVAVMFRSVPAITFAIGAAGYLWLLSVDNLDRVRRFGRRFTGDGRDVDAWEPSPLAAAGRRLALIGVVVALVLPLGVPGMTTGLVDRFSSGLTGLGGSGSGSGSGEVNLFAALDGLLNRDEVLEMVEVTTTDSDPHYLRFGVADQLTADGFDHRRPRGTPVAAGVEGPVSRAGVTPQEHRATVRVLPNFSMRRLPVYGELRNITGVDGDAWRYDPQQQAIFSPGETATGVEYEFEYARPEFDPDALRQAPPLPPNHDLLQFAEIPDELREEAVSDLVAELTDGIDNLYDQVLAVLGYFSADNDFRYSLETGNATTGSAIVDFLIVNKQGYCVQFAAGMAWMVRELGLPSRVVIGFTSGPRRAEGSFTLTNFQAHAWPEVYFHGIGWVPFEPTPRLSVGGSVTPDWAPDPNAPDVRDPSDPQQADPAEPSGEVDPTGEDQFIDEFGGGTSGGPGPAQTVPRMVWWALAGVALLLGLLAVPALSRAWLRRRRLRTSGAPADPGAPIVETPAMAGAPPGGAGARGVATDDPAARRRAHAAWDELLDTMVDFGVAVDPAETPRMASARLARQHGLDQERAGRRGKAAAGDGVRLLGHAEERARYARTPAPAGNLLGALKAVRGVLASQATWSGRMRALLLPPSTLRRWRQRVTDTATGAASRWNRWVELLGRLSPRRLLRSP